MTASHGKMLFSFVLVFSINAVFGAQLRRYGQVTRRLKGSSHSKYSRGVDQDVGDGVYLSPNYQYAATPDFLLGLSGKGHAPWEKSEDLQIHSGKGVKGSQSKNGGSKKRGSQKGKRVYLGCVENLSWGSNGDYFTFDKLIALLDPCTDTRTPNASKPKPKMMMGTSKPTRRPTNTSISSSPSPTNLSDTVLPTLQAATLEPSATVQQVDSASPVQSTPSVSPNLSSAPTSLITASGVPTDVDSKAPSITNAPSTSAPSTSLSLTASPVLAATSQPTESRLSRIPAVPLTLSPRPAESQSQQPSFNSLPTSAPSVTSTPTTTAAPTPSSQSVEALLESKEEESSLLSNVAAVFGAIGLLTVVAGVADRLQKQRRGRIRREFVEKETIAAKHQLELISEWARADDSLTSQSSYDHNDVSDTMSGLTVNSLRSGGSMGSCDASVLLASILDSPLQSHSQWVNEAPEDLPTWLCTVTRSTDTDDDLPYLPH